MSPLIKNLSRKLKEQNFSALSFEKKFELPTQSVHNILKGRSTSPNVYLILKIVKALECSMEELLEEDPQDISARFSPNNSLATNQKTSIDEPSLLTNTLKYVIEVFKEKNKPLKIDPILYITKEAYFFFEQKSTKKIDKEFLEWFVIKHI